MIVIQLVFLHADANSTDILFYIWFLSFREQFFGLSSTNRIFFVRCVPKRKIISIKKLVPVLTRQGRSILSSRARFFSSTAMKPSCRWQIFLFLECSSLILQHWQDNHYPPLFKTIGRDVAAVFNNHCYLRQIFFLSPDYIICRNSLGWPCAIIPVYRVIIHSKDLRFKFYDQFLIHWNHIYARKYTSNVIYLPKAYHLWTS